ncbi:MAG: putative lipid II flippase FtsW [Sarcina sp.]
MRGLKTSSRKKRTKNSLKDYPFDYALLVVILVILSFGVIMVYSASFYKGIIDYSNSSYFFVRQAAFAVIGLIGMYVVSRINYKYYKKLVMIGLAASFLMVMITILKIPGMTHSALGATRWLKFGFITVQPSEFVKYAVVLAMAVKLSDMGAEIKSFKKGVLRVLGVAAFFSVLIIVQKNLSIAGVILITAIIMIFAAGAKLKHMGILFSFGATMATLAVLIAPFRMKRIMSFMNPWADPSATGYQIIQSFYALGSGGLFGLGLGESRQKTMYLPEPHNDFIFAIIAEELGLIGCIFLILLFVFFVYRGIVIAITAKDSYGRFLALGITSIIGVQAIINIAVVTGSMPVTGVPLPFMSYGGTALCINLFAMGVLLNISRFCKKKI